MIIDEIWTMFLESFPKNERRTFEDQKKLFENKYYNCKVYKEDKTIKAFICYWKFDDFIFVEHFAVNKNSQGTGIGTKILDEIKTLKLPIVLEVEPPDEKNINTMRRIKFYKKNGFSLNNYFYEQPPLNKYSDYLELKLLSFPEPLEYHRFESVRDMLLQHVY